MAHLSRQNKSNQTFFKESHTWSRDAQENIVRIFESDAEQGLLPDEVSRRIKLLGYNELEKKKSYSLFILFLKQLQSPLVFLLIAAAVTTFFLDHTIDTIVIVCALLINIIVGLVQEGRASKAFDTLNESQEQFATVIRGGSKHRIHSRELVPGDIVVLEPGSLVPADMRLIESRSVELDESVLTGESLPVSKTVEILQDVETIADMKNMAWMGTVVVAGTAVGIVVSTGKYTEIGKIAQELVGRDHIVTPIQKSTTRIAQFLALVALISIITIVSLGIIRGESFIDMLLVSIAIAVSAVPEGLPAAVTIVLAIGMERLLSKGGLVRNLRAAETLGSTTIILTDKTGTLTKALMTLRDIVSLDRIVGKEGPENTILEYAVLSSDAYIEGPEEQHTVQGRPIEKAIITAALEKGLHDVVHRVSRDRIEYGVFTSVRKYSESLISEKEYNLIIISGAPEIILGKSDQVLTKQGILPLSEESRNLFLKEQQERSDRGERLIAVAYTTTDKTDLSNTEKISYIFGGFLSFSDPVREDVASAIHKAQKAGIQVVVVTGDNPGTAKSVACEVGVAQESSKVIHGAEFDALTDDDLINAVYEGAVFARVVPAQKMRLAQVLRSRGEVVAMTGDGVNDAPALRNADIGIAVGSGTDVAKEASDLVLVDNSFSIIVTAIQEGRRILDNLRKIVIHLTSTNFGEIVVIVGALLFAFPLPLLPAQILWMNIVQEGFLNFAFAFEPASSNVMSRDPREEEASELISTNVRTIIIVMSVLTGLCALILFFILSYSGVPIEEIRSILFVAITLAALFFTFSLKDFYEPLWKIPMRNNIYLLFAVCVSALLLIGAFLIPPLSRILSLTPLKPGYIILLIGIALFNLVTIEIAKYFIFARKKQKSI